MLRHINQAGLFRQLEASKRSVSFLKPLGSTLASHFLFNKEIVAANQLEYGENDNETHAPSNYEGGRRDRLYPSHIPLNPLAKFLLFAKSSVGSFVDPGNNVNINQLGETFPVLSKCWLDYSYKSLLKDDRFDGRDIIMNKPDYRHILKDYLYVLDEPEKYSNTMAYQMLKYLSKNKITLESREEVHYIDDINYQFVYNKYRQSHDFHHLVIGNLPTSIEGEIIIKLVEGINMGLPLGVIGGLLSPLHLKDVYIIKKIYSKYLSLIIDLNKQMNCNMLLINWSNYLLKDVDEIRYMIGGDSLVSFAKWIGDDVRELKKMRREVVKKQKSEAEEL